MTASEVNLTDKDIERLVKIIVVLSDDEASSAQRLSAAQCIICQVSAQSEVNY